MVVPVRRIVTGLAVAAALFIVGCGAETAPVSPTGSVTGPSPAGLPVTSDSSGPTSPLPPQPPLTSEPIQPAPSPAEQPPAQPPPPPIAEPYVVECLDGTPGPARWSDGTTRYSQWCFDTRGGERYLEEESQSGADPTSANPPDPYGRGYTCDASGDCRWPDGSPVIGADRCGERCGEPPTWADEQREWWDCVSVKSEEQCREELGGQ